MQQHLWTELHLQCFPKEKPEAALSLGSTRSPAQLGIFSEHLHSESYAQEKGVWLIRATENLTLTTRCRRVATGSLEIEKGRSLPSLVCVEPAKKSIQAVLPARVLTRVTDGTRQISLQPSQFEHFKSKVSKPRALVVLAHFRDTSLVVLTSTVLGVAEQVSEDLFDKMNSGKPYADARIKTQCRGKNEFLYNKLLKGTLDYLSRQDKVKVEPVLRRFAHVFHDEGSNDFKATDVVEQKIILEYPTPIRRRQ